MRFLVDAALAPGMSEWLVGRGHDSLHVSELGMQRAPDGDILAYALRDKRILVTADLDFPTLFALLGVQRPGLVLFRGGDYTTKDAQEMIARSLQQLPASDFENCVIVLQKERIRLRRLPMRPHESK